MSVSACICRFVDRRPILKLDLGERSKLAVSRSFALQMFALASVGSGGMLGSFTDCICQFVLTSCSVLEATAQSLDLGRVVRQ